MSDLTLFEKIHQGAIPAKFLHKDDLCFAIEDIEPKAPFHALIISVKPIPSLAEVQPEDAAIISACVQAARKVAKEAGLVKGWRLVTNVGPDSGQAVPHLHFHLLGGRKLGWSPG